MKEEELQNITNSIKEKLGEDNTALIADDLGILFTKNTEVQNNISDMNKEISSLKDKNDKLVTANGNLLQQIPMGIKEVKKDEPKQEETYFDYHSMFDESGNFKQN